MLESDPSVHFRVGNLPQEGTMEWYGKLPLAGVPSVHSSPVLVYGQSLAGETSIGPFQRDRRDLNASPPGGDGNDPPPTKNRGCVVLRDGPN